MSTTRRYEHDIHAWTQWTAEWLGQRRFQDIDIEHLAEELESMGRRDRRELVSRLKILLGHLLNWQRQPPRRSSAGRGSILEQRLRIRDLLQESSSLRPFFAKAVASAYGDGARLASKETGSPRPDFPDQSPFSLDGLLDDDWLPEQCEQLF